MRVAKETFEPDCLDMATVLENMATLYKEMDKEDEAEILEERARKIRSKNP